MKKIIDDLRKKTPAELERLIGEARGKLKDLEFKVRLGQVKNPSEIGKLRHEVARYLTIHREISNK